MFGIVVLLLGVGIPAWALTREGSEDSAAENVASGLQEGKDLFVINCGACHTPVSYTHLTLPTNSRV